MKLIEIDECIRRTTIKGKTTAIIASCQSEMRVFMWSIFSLLLRSSNKLEHVIVCLNGPDERTGSPELQDKKQRFVEELRSMNVPLTLIRVWSRVGHPPSLEMAIPWVHTEMYTIMHDDIIIRQNDWLEKATDELENENVIWVYAPPLLMNDLTKYKNDKKISLKLPHPNSAFITCRTDRISKYRYRWIGFHIEKEFQIENHYDYSNYIDYHKSKNLLNIEYDDDRFPTQETKYNCLSLDIGYFLFNECLENNLEFKPLDDNAIHHFVGSSWKNKSLKDSNHPFVDELEEEITQSRFSEIYNKYK
jgi:hypothetical protein